MPEGKTTRAMNEYLDKMGAAYSIEFQGLPYSLENDENIEYITALRKNIKSADLLYTGWPGRGYLELAEEEQILCLDEYLLTEEGGRLYEAVPVDNWYGVTIGDSIYGVTGDPYSWNTAPGYTVNRELIKKYVITDEEISKPLYELEDVIQ